MEFVDNTGHMFSLKSYSDKPIGYEYDENDYIFWIDSNNTSKLSINNYYSRPIYALYELNKDFNVNELENDHNKIIDIEIYFNDSNVFKLISSKRLQRALSNKTEKLTDYINLNIFEDGEEIYNFIKDSLTNEDLYCIKTKETLKDTADINYLLIPIYPIALAKEEGTWISNLMIHIHNNSNDTDEWCPISVGGEFISEYEELIINGRNMGVNLPKDILKSVYSESLYNDEFNEALYNEKIKEYMINYMNIRGEIGNFKSAIDSLKWFGYGNKITIAKLLRTDNDFKQQYLLDYFDISNDILESFKTFVSDALISLRIMINKESDEQYPLENTNIEKTFYGENKPKMISLIDNYEKIRIGNHDMPIEDDEEKYWYWKPYFDFSFNELGVKLICLSYYYKKYFLPIHLNIHSTSLGYRVFANDIKLTNTIGISQSEPSVILNNKNEVIFTGNGLHYFTKQIHYIDDKFNEYDLGSNNVETDERTWYYLNDTCVNIPIYFKENQYYNCVLLLFKDIDKTLYNSINKLVKEYYSDNNSKLTEFINILKTCKNDYKILSTDDIETVIANTHLDINKTNNELNEFVTYVGKLLNKIEYASDLDKLRSIINIINNDSTEVLYESHFNFIQSDNNKYKNFIIYPKKFNINIDKNGNVNSNYFNYWIDNKFILKLLVNNRWYEYNFELRIHNPQITFGKLKYRYFSNDHNYLLNKTNEQNNLHNIVFCDSKDVDKILDENKDFYLLKSKYIIQLGQLNIDNIKNELESYNIINIDDYAYVTLFNLTNGNYFIQWDNIDEQLCYIYNFNKSILDIYNKCISTISINNNAQYLIYPKSWGEPIFIENNCKKFNDLIRNIYALDNNESWVETFDYNNIDYIYQFFKQNYFLLSPFKQLKYIDDDNKQVLFNSYMHNEELVNINDINFDININQIIKYHLDHNLLYIDGTLLNNEFYQFIKYIDIMGIEHEIYLHKDLIGKNIIFNAAYIGYNKTLICAYEGNDIYILNEEYNENGESSYYIIDCTKESEKYSLFRHEGHENDEEFDYHTYISYDNIVNLYYDPINNTYVNGETVYTIYDKLYFNTDQTMSKYQTLVNLPNSSKYKNSIHIFNIYENKLHELNVLEFHDNINMWIDGLNFVHNTKYYNIDDNIEHINEEKLKIYITGNQSTFIDTRYPDTYGLHWASVKGTSENKPLVPIEKNSIDDYNGFYVHRDYSLYYTNSNPLEIWKLPNIFEYDTEEFSYYEDKNKTYIGYYLYNNLDDFYINRYIEKTLIDEYKDNDIDIHKEETGNIVISIYDPIVKNIYNIKENYKYNVYYTISFTNESKEDIDVSLNDIEKKTYKYVKVKFYINKIHIVRNRFYTVNEYLNYLTKENIPYYEGDTFDSNGYKYKKIIIRGVEYNIRLIEFKYKYIYEDVKSDENNNTPHNISNQNPSMYWFDIDENSLVSLPSHLNNIERFIDNNESPEELISNLDKYIELHEQYGRYSPDSKYAKYKYKNYLAKDLTGYTGTYRIELLSNTIVDNNIILYVEVIDKDGNIVNYDNVENNILTLNGSEQCVTLFMQIAYGNFKFIEGSYVIPKLIKIYNAKEQLKYIPKESGKNLVTAKYLNKEYIYGDNNNEYVYNLYNKFFKLDYNVYDIYLSNKILKKQLLHSVYNCVDSIKLDTYLNYDFYLMHDNDYWYGIYISQETVDNARNKNDLILKNDDKTKYINNEYILEYYRSSEEYLINRLEFNSTEGFNQFNNDDIIACYIYNNDRLPFNANISSKWKISPISLGTNIGTSFESNGEMTILSLPKNNNVYERGYYKIDVKYSLDRDIQHQFKNTTTIKIN